MGFEKALQVTSPNDSNDIRYMKMAHGLAIRAAGRTGPNPLVGAVVVRQGKVVGRGYHHRRGSPHAEVLALEQAGPLAEGATLYVTLEPCCHLKKKTPPCLPYIFKNGIRRVVVSLKDPNPRVNGRSIQALRKKGIRVDVGLLAHDSLSYNEHYIKFIQKGIPFVTLKVAASLDGKISAGSGQSRWITGKSSRAFVHRLRARHDALLVGIETVIHDDPLLTSRWSNGKLRKEPLRIILDRHLRIPVDSRIIRNLDPSKTLVVTGTHGSERAFRSLEKRGVQVLVGRTDRFGVDLKWLMRTLGKKEITSVMIEGGAQVNASALRSGVVDKIIFIFAPMIIGGLQAKGAVEGVSPRSLRGARRLGRVTSKKLGEDFLVEGYLH